MMNPSDHPGTPPAARWQSRPFNRDGFTLVEVMVAAVVLAVGLIGAFTMLDVTVKTSFRTRAREGAVNLAREITEDARSLPYSSLTNSNVTSQLQALPGLANQASGGSSWQIVRRGVTYTVTATEADTTGTEASGQSVTLKQVTVTVQYTVENHASSVQQSATINPTTSSTSSTSLTASNLQMATPAVGSGNAGTAVQPLITSSSVTSATFSVTEPSGASSIVWTVDGVALSGSSSTSGTTVTSPAWSISGLSDGTYTIGAAAESSSGSLGPTITLSVELARGAPPAPTLTRYGYNTNFRVNGSPTVAAEFEWQADHNLNVIGYRLYNPSGTLLCQTSTTTSYTCSANVWCPSATDCVDESPPASTSANLTYTVAAIYDDSSGNLQQGPSSSATLVGSQTATFYFANTTANTGTNCASATTVRDMSTSYTPGGTQYTDLSGSDIFCSDSFTAGEELVDGGTATVYFANNSSNRTCSITGTLTIDGSTSSQSASQSISAGQTKGLAFTWSGTTATRMNSGDRFDAAFSFTPSSCANGANKTSLLWGSTSTPSQFQTKLAYPAPPNPPTGLSVTRTSGTATLTWTPPSSGPSVSEYRIYRDGSNYSNRVIPNGVADPTADCTTTCTWQDPLTDTSSHTYYVTAVGNTTSGSNAAESVMSAGVTG